jgi:hypothetical protein
MAVASSYPAEQSNIQNTRVSEASYSNVSWQACQRLKAGSLLVDPSALVSLSRSGRTCYHNTEFLCL